MKTGSLRRRTLAATLGVLLAALGAFATIITLRYQDGLRAQARSQLLAAARAMENAPGAQLKPLGASLALEGIDAQFSSAPRRRTAGQPDRRAHRPRVVQAAGELITYSEPISINGRPATVTLSSSERSVTAAVNRLIAIELIGAAIVLAAAVLLTWLALRSALAPLRQVSATAQRIAAGDRQQRLSPRRPDTELGRMAASFDAMVDSLDQAVTQATRSEATMRRFIADASHELRSPVAALHATAETLLRQQPERPARDRLEADVARGTQRLGRLVDDLLNLARLEANEPVRANSVDLVEVTNAVIADARTHTTAHISLSHSGPAPVIGDPDGLARAVRNLLDNAIRAGGDHGDVQVEVRTASPRVYLSVSDDGPGIPVGERERIFDGFVRLESSPATGTGLGLAIARAIAHQHHGEIACVDSASGAKFTLELPVANPTPVAQQRLEVEVDHSPSRRSSSA